LESKKIGSKKSKASKNLTEKISFWKNKIDEEIIKNKRRLNCLLANFFSIIK
jgi:hypothetical protein